MVWPGQGFVLALDTALAHCAVAVVRYRHQAGETIHEVLVSKVERMATGQAERLLPLAEEALAAEGLTWKDLDALGVGIGPGNFTGTRIGVAAVRGLALGLGIPAVGVSYFDAMAPDHPYPWWALVPGPLGRTSARRMGHPEEAPTLLSEDEVEALTEDRVWLGDVPVERVVATMACVTASRFRSPTLERPAPLYLRAPDAAPSREAVPAILAG